MTRRTTRSSLRTNLILAICSIIFTLVGIELILRLFIPVTDYPIEVTFDPEIGYHYIPGDEGRYSEGAFGQIMNAHFHINAQGFNAPHDYVKEKDIWRIAVIGDSFVEGFQVDVDKAFPEQLAQILNDSSACPPVEVYRFGWSGASLSHYAGVMPYIANEYHPDLFIVNIISNDFDESFVEYGEPWFWDVTLNDEGRYEFVPPRAPEQEESGIDLYRLLATRRYVTWNLRLWRLAPRPDPAPPDPELYEPLTYFLLSEMQQVAQQEQAELLITMESDRASEVYGEEDQSEVLAIYQPLVENATTELGIPYLDLGAAFQEDYEANHQRFDFKTDYHWNEHGHQVVAQAIADWLIEHKCTTQ